MGHKLKTFIITFCLIVGLMWHHQATLFQRQVRETVKLLRAYGAPTVQLGDILISKYLFKVEFKKPHLDINSQSLEKMKDNFKKDSGFFYKFIQKQLDSLPAAFRLNYRLGDRLVVTYNPFWNELTLTFVGDGELSLQTESEKIDFLASDQNDFNQGKVKIFLPTSGWIQKIKQFFFKDAVNVMSITSSCRNMKIVTASDQEPVYTQDYGSSKFTIDEGVLDGKNCYKIDLALQVDNAYFSPTLAKIWPFLELYVLGNKTNRKETYKICIEKEEGKAFVTLLLSYLNSGQIETWKALVQATPPLKIEAKSGYQNNACAFSTDYHVEYQPQKNYLKTACDTTFQAYSVWPVYLEKLCDFYQSITTHLHGSNKAPPKAVSKPLWYLLLANLKGKGEVKAGFMIELQNMISDQLQAQGSLKIGVENSGFAVRGSYKFPSLLNIDIDFEDPETFLNKLHSYTLSSLEGASHKVAEIMLPGLKNNLMESIQKLGVVKNEDQPHVRTIPIHFNNDTNSLEISGEPVHDEFMEVVTMLIGILAKHDFLQDFKKLTTLPASTTNKNLAPAAP